MAVRAYIGLGSNLGDSAAILDSACEALARVPGVRVLRRSANSISAPVGGPAGQRDYLNGVLEVDSELSAESLLRHLQVVELEHGRRREHAVRWGPRTLDLDLLLFGDERRDTPELVLPHPRLEERSFVLNPLVELAPDLILPGSGRTARAVSSELDTRTGAVLPELPR